MTVRHAAVDEPATGEYADERTGSFRAALLQDDQLREPLVDKRLLLASEGGDDEGVLLAQVAGQVVVAPVEAASRERQPSRAATAECCVEAFERAVTGAIDREPEKRFGVRRGLVGARSAS